MISTFMNGFMTAGVMIIAIGAQNVYVLKKGLRKEQVFLVCLICFSCDVILMTIGVLGLGVLISHNIFAQLILASAGAIFLIFYGLASLKNAFYSKNLVVSEHQETPVSRRKAITQTLAITLLNPHVYLDTVVVVGGIAGTLSLFHKLYFLMGALIASAIWFFGLGYGASYLAPIFKKSLTWKLLDITIALIMFYISLKLIEFIANNI